jgi:hypothetical protein
VCVGVALLYAELLSVVLPVYGDESSPTSLMIILNTFFKTHHKNKSCMLKFGFPDSHNPLTLVAH